jgi:deoxyadenosine/deoxycytidine kinase
MRIEVIGGIASGKSTLAAALGDAGMQIVAEEFSKNPFFEQFYKDPAGYAFEAEITYLLQHYSAIKCGLTLGNGALAADFSLALDLAYAFVTLDSDDRQIFLTVLERIIDKIGVPNLIVKLDCSAEVEFERIRARNRVAEQTVSIQYLQDLNAATERALGDALFQAVPVTRIDSQALDFRPGAKDRAAVVACVIDACREIDKRPTW